MDGDKIVRIEASVDSAAAAVYAAATGLVLHLLNASNGYIAVGMAVAFAGCLYGLRSIEPEFVACPLPGFDARPFEAVDLDELLLTDFVRPAQASEDALVLDDMLAKPGPDSRVVRLFDPAAMPTSEQDAEKSAPADASQALHDALAELRRSLR
jgi:hypothetical protein